MMIVDKYTKYSYIIAFKQNYIVKQLKIIVLKNLINYYRIPKEITSNRNKFFISN